MRRRREINLIQINEKRPSVDKDAYIDPTAILIGDVRVKKGVGIWPGAVIRADEGPVILEKDVMVLENVVIESSRVREVTIGRKSIISHGAIVHGAIVGEKSTVGIGAIVLDGSEIMDSVIIGSAALIPPGKKIQNKTLILGVPGKVIRTLSKEDLKRREEEWFILKEKVPLYRSIRMSDKEVETS